MSYMSKAGLRETTQTRQGAEEDRRQSKEKPMLSSTGWNTPEKGGSCRMRNTPFRIFREGVRPSAGRTSPQGTGGDRPSSARKAPPGSRRSPCPGREAPAPSARRRPAGPTKSLTRQPLYRLYQRAPQPYEYQSQHEAQADVKAEIEPVFLLEEQVHVVGER